MSGIGAGLAGLRVRISFFHAREQISIVLRVMPAPVPTDTYLDPYLCPSGFISVDLRVFSARRQLLVQYWQVPTQPARLLFPSKPTSPTGSPPPRPGSGAAASRIRGSPSRRPFPAPSDPCCSCPTRNLPPPLLPRSHFTPSPP